MHFPNRKRRCVFVDIGRSCLDRKAEINLTAMMHRNSYIACQKTAKWLNPNKNKQNGPKSILHQHEEDLHVAASWGHPKASLLNQLLSPLLPNTTRICLGHRNGPDISRTQI